MMHHPQRDHYKVLGLHRDAGHAEVKQAFRRLVKEIHPDRNDSARAAELFHAVHTAYSTLIDPVLREQYDTQLTRSRPARAPQPSPSRQASPARKREPDDGALVGRPAPVWAYVGLHITGLLFGLLLILGTCWMIVFRDHSWGMLIFTAPGWFLVPDCVEGLRFNNKAGN